MPEQIYKLQPNRTIQLRGFDDLGASAAIHAATANSFKVSGTFRDAADFAVVVLYDADNFFEHPRLRYLPDFDFSDLTLQFDVSYSGLMPLDSPKFPTIDWPYLDVTLADNNSTPAQIRLFDHAMQVGGTYTQATGSISIVNNGMQAGDRITLWYLNYAFEYVVGQLQCSFAFSGAGEGTVHWVDVDGVRYQTTEVAGDTTSAIIDRLVSALSASSKVSATNTGGFQIDIFNIATDGAAYVVAASSGGSYVLSGDSAGAIASVLAGQITAAAYTGESMALSATAVGAAINIQSVRPGVDGNYLTVYVVSTSSRLTADKTHVQLAGGSSDATWRVTLDFSALGITNIRRMWLTLAPPLRYGTAIDSTEWQANFTNWTLSGPDSRKLLQVASPGSVRVEETDRWCTYTGNWPSEEGFFSGGFAKRSSVVGNQVTIQYSCAATHDLYAGTSLYTDRAQVDVFVDGVPQSPLNTYLNTGEAVNTRRIIASGIPAGEHVVSLQQTTTGHFYFDFLEAAIPGDVPDALPAVVSHSPALDYSTDHTYKLSPARIMWSFDKLGFAGPMNQYLGVFWWNQRQRVNAVIPFVTVTFSGTFVAGDAIFVEIGGQTVGKSVFLNETNDIFASHFAYMINAQYVGVYAEASGNVLTITTRSPKDAYAFSFNAWAETVGGSSGAVSVIGSLSGGVSGAWVVDPTQSPAINRGAREWLSDMFAECKARDREITVATSMELVNPPAGFASLFPDGVPVETSVGFGSLTSTHCAFSTPMLNYHKSVYTAVAELMSSALLTPSLQLGEFVWWFFTNWSSSNLSGGMGFYDSETGADAAIALGRPLHRFTQPTDDPSVNGGADAMFLRNRLRDYAAALVSHVKTAYPSAKFELLFPYDVTHPQPAGTHNLGGALNRFVSFPTEWEAKATSGGLDRIKMEALDFGAWSRDLGLCKTAMEFPLSLAWPRDSIRYLVPVFRPASPWQKEYLMAKGLGIPIINYWAYDHFCLYGIDTREPQNRGSAAAN